MTDTDDKTKFTTFDILEANASHLLVALAVIFFSYALEHGQAGTIQAISNCKILVQTLLSAAIDGKMPTALQIGGLALGICGVTVIIMMKKGS